MAAPRQVHAVVRLRELAATIARELGGSITQVTRVGMWINLCSTIVAPSEGKGSHQTSDGECVEKRVLELDRSQWRDLPERRIGGDGDGPPKVPPKGARRR